MIKQNSPSLILAALASITLLAGCATESHQAIAPTKTQVSQMGGTYHGKKYTVAIGKFENQSPYLRGIFSDGIDRLGAQAKVILTGHLQQTGRFIVLDRSNLEEIEQESELRKQQSDLLGARFVLSGQVTEFGRKEVGDHQLYGILGSGKKQIAYAKVVVNVIDVTNSAVIYSAQGAGEYALSNREVVGFGGTASYDSTLNGKVLDLALREAVDALSQSVDQNRWPTEQ